MKKTLLFLLLVLLGLAILFLRPHEINALGGGEGGDGGVDVGADGSGIANPAGIPNESGGATDANGGYSGEQLGTTNTCSNGHGTETVVSVNGGYGGFGGNAADTSVTSNGGTPLPGYSCVPDSQACPAYQVVTRRQSGNHFVSQQVDVPCCNGTCNNGVCGNPPPPPPNNPPPACGASCSSNIDCAQIPGCTSCVGATTSGLPTCYPIKGTGPTGPSWVSTDGHQFFPCDPFDTACASGQKPPATCQSSGSGGSRGGTCQAPPPPINCGSSCVKDTDCTGAAVFNCGACVNNICAPTPTPTIIDCGTSCVKDSDCAGAATFECGACVNNKCASPPPKCGSACKLASDCNGAPFNCNACVENKCGAIPTPTLTPVPPTPTFTPVPPTPTPTFNPASCTCDGINYQNLATGQNATITSFAKITGDQAARGIITGQKFFLTQGADDTHGQIIAQSGFVPATSTGSQYQSVWNFKLPTLVSGNTYRIWSAISCQPRNTGFNNSEVAGVSTQVPDTSILGKLVAFVRGIFGVKEENNFAAAPNPVKIASQPQNPSVLAAQSQSLQLGTISPIDVYFKGCDAIKFRYNF